VDTLFTFKWHYFRRQSAVPTQNKEKRVFAKTFEKEKNVESDVALAQEMAYFHHKKYAPRRNL
jgi:hypothetical protein